ncbi:UDP-N-acetylmuramoyl-tripeptide--D-alanyl-D-alanine ligase [Pseudogracilibacillus auburnensis]|uniref:UDP-N-acetylmuramoyl-tripeptide--D-alanyl-D-alanine ligase n=1 Tax=Pseudogracilibacillus auburnensis TaxID=1494959 RepID=A0A2V3W478_9BACI|nr:UDP-N-acetylmuramoyl-tripeptide--D-alanyl-D-alanine ligase [Pseudogracilibacillus auburnensis]PXW88516.1 UDP-N-acetylmuramoyl-tripeptide--D-alanyl-D-alanine ligase [Pseudogracilibacillus auburnensis]
MLFTLRYLQAIFPSVSGLLEEELEIKQIMTDSRMKQEDALFIPIVGENFNGHDFIHDAIEQGAVAALWEKSVEIPENISSSFVFFIVDDTINALQQLAKFYKKEINPTIIGITGSNGKTTTKDLMAAVLKTTFNTCATVGNFNNHIGLPLTILQMKRDTEMLILEMGMNHFHEIDLLTKIAEPNFAVITNIGESHIEHLGSREGIAKAKLEIKNGLQADGLLILDGDEALLKSFANDKQVITCGFGMENDTVISNVQLTHDQTTFQIGNNEYYSIPLLGNHQAKNASYVITIAKKLGISIDNIKLGLQALEHSHMRFELLKGKNGVSIINDAYNASATSMKAAIMVMKQMDGFNQKIVVLGDILELGEYAKTLHRSVAEVIDQPIDVLFTYGNHAKIISDEVKRTKSGIRSNHFDTKEALLKGLENYIQKDTLILFKASRGMAFEQFIHEIV